MTVEILKIEEYKDTAILVKRTGEIFEYIVFFKHKFYHGYNVFRLPIFRKIFGQGFKQKEIEDATRILLTQAHTTADLITTKK